MGEGTLKHRFRMILIMFFLCCNDWGLTAAPSGVLLRCADVHRIDYPTIQGVLYMAQRLKERTKGRVEIVIYPQGRLGTEKSAVEMVQLGALDMARVSVSQVAETAPELEILMLPYLFLDNRHKWQVLEGTIGTELLEGLSRHGLIGLCFQEAGYRSFYNRQRPIYRPEDLRGLKIRVQPSQAMIKMVEYLGAVAVPIDYTEVQDALMAGVIDGAENNIPSYATSGHSQAARYYSLDRHSSIPEVVIFSKRSLAKLTPAEQTILREAARESVSFQRGLWPGFEAKCLRQLEREGCRFNEVDGAAFQKALRPILDGYARRNRLVEEIRNYSSALR